jgi:O-antigen/teichoic acid export membrane protein
MLRYFRQLVSESMVYGISGVAARFVSIFLVPIYTRIFTPHDYGVLSLVTTTMTLVSTLVVLALDASAHRWFWDTEQTEERKNTLASWAWCQIAVTTLFAALILATSNYLGRVIVGQSEAGLYFRISAMGLLFGVLNIVVTGWLRMQRRPWATTLFGLGTSLLNILLTVALVAFLHEGLKGVFLAQAISMAAGSAIAIALMRDWLNPRWFRWARLKEMLRYALPLIPGYVAIWVLTLSDRYFVNFFASTSELGLYSVASSIASVLVLGISAFRQAWVPFAFSIHKEPEAKQVYAHVFLAYLWVACAVSTGLQLLAPEAIRLLATPKYLGASSVVGLLALGNAISGLQYVAAIGPAIAKDSRPVGIAAMLGAALNILCNLALVPPMGKLGSAIATLLSQTAVAVYLFYRAQKLFRIPYRFGPAVGTVGLALALMWLGHGLHFGFWWVTVLAKLALISVFIPCLFLFRMLSFEQARRIYRGLRQSGIESEMVE